MILQIQSLRLGSRESPLALAQTHHVASRLQQTWPELSIEIKTFKTQGDLILDKALSKAGDKGLFVKELETALLNHEIDLAVHSMKDMPGELPEGLAVISVSEREDPRDVLLSQQHIPFSELPAGAIIGTSSLRREAQLRRLRPDLSYQVIRGNLQTRYRKLEEGSYAAIVLAAAGVRRLGWEDRITQTFDAWTESIPAVAQGILGVEFRKNDHRIAAHLAPLQIQSVEIAGRAERAVLSTLNGGCQLPLGAYCREIFGGFEMRGVVLSVDGTQALYTDIQVDVQNPEISGQHLAEQLLFQGGQEILSCIQKQPSPPINHP